MGFRERLRQGLVNVQERGYFVTEQNLRGKGFWCCQNCGIHALPSEVKNYVFYHEQDAGGFKETPPGLHLAWGGDGEEIKKCLLEAGLAVKWDGTEASRFYVTVPVEN